MKYNTTKLHLQEPLIRECLSNFDFKKADSIFYSSIEQYLSYDSKIALFAMYEKIRLPYVESFINQKLHLKNPFDSEQIAAIGSVYEGTKVSARAGSGKTTVIAGKIAFSILAEKVSPQSILTLSFNKKAATEISERLIKAEYGFGIDGYDFSQTFHALAYSIAYLGKKEKPKILIDIEKYDDPKTGITVEYKPNKQLKFIQQCFLNVYPKLEPFIKDLHKDYGYINKVLHLNLSDEEYIGKIENDLKKSMTGEIVRSKGEKYILDFLLKYGFKDIQYESIINFGSKVWKPDVQCSYPGINKPIYIEHWAIPDQPLRKNAMNWAEHEQNLYLNRKKEKRQYFYHQESIGKKIFIETDTNDIPYGENEAKLFELHLKNKFEQKLNIQLYKIENSRLVKNIRESNKTILPITKQLQQYIQKAQSQRKNPDAMRDEILNFQSEDPEILSFLKLANLVYREYIRLMEEKNAIDFNTMLSESVEILHTRKCDTYAMLGTSILKLDQLKYILVDEYQDFSPLFYGLLEVLILHNPGVKLFVVGDDWQSINMFAGADLKYFLDFKKYFNGLLISDKTISTNYRSSSVIVNIGNNIMQDVMDGSIAKSTGKIHGIQSVMINTEDEPIYNYHDDIIEELFPIKNDAYSTTSSLIMAHRRVFKYMLNIVINTIKEDKTILILSRNNLVYGIELGNWKIYLEKYFEKSIYKEQKNISVRREKIKKYFNSDKLQFFTCHKSKGKQADIVVLLSLTHKDFPISIDELRKNKNYFLIFNDTPENILLNERKLFYVAVTRAKSQFICFYETGNKSGFLKYIE